MQQTIKIMGENMHDYETEIINKVILLHYPKIAREIDVIAFLELRLKKYNLQGQRIKYSIHIIVRIRERKFESNNSGWALYSAVRKGLQKIALEIKKFYAMARTNN